MRADALLQVSMDGQPAPTLEYRADGQYLSTYTLTRVGTYIIRVVARDSPQTDLINSPANVVVSIGTRCPPSSSLSLSPSESHAGVDIQANGRKPRRGPCALARA
jgi:hypothetical protein